MGRVILPPGGSTTPRDLRSLHREKSRLRRIPSSPTSARNTCEPGTGSARDTWSQSPLCAPFSNLHVRMIPTALARSARFVRAAPRRWPHGRVCRRLVRRPVQPRPGSPPLLARIVLGVMGSISPMWLGSAKPILNIAGGKTRARGSGYRLPRRQISARARSCPRSALPADERTAPRDPLTLV
jgi:hypothetical protein